MEQKVVQAPAAAQSNTVVVWISKVMAGVAAVTLFVMMMIAVVDVCGRFFFNSPINGSFELGGILLVTAGTWGMGFCQLRKNNIRIDVITGRFPKRGRILFDIFAYIFCITAAGAVTWRVAVMTGEYITTSQGGLTATLLIPYWPFMLTLAMGFGWLTIIFIFDLINSLIEVAKK
jgi:TRAP-type C4-dicarboxylate transport system permease small subunit